MKKVRTNSSNELRPVLNSVSLKSIHHPLRCINFPGSNDSKTRLNSFGLYICLNLRISFLLLESRFLTCNTSFIVAPFSFSLIEPNTRIVFSYIQYIYNPWKRQKPSLRSMEHKFIDCNERLGKIKS